MTIEEQLKELIITRYNSLSNFSNKINVSNSTVDSIFKRGIENANVSNIIKICTELGISTDELAKGSIVFYEGIISNNNMSSEAKKIAMLYDLASERDKSIVRLTLEPYEEKNHVKNAEPEVM